jgi:hypothetical protein
MEKKQTNPLVQYGLLSAAVGLITYIGLYLGGVKLMTSPVAYATYLLPILFAVLGCVAAKKQNGGFLEFGQALKISFGIFVITTLASSLFSYVLLNFIDPEFKEAMQQVSIEMTEKMMKRFGASQDQIDKALDDASKKDNFSFGSVMLGFAFSCFISFLISLIIAVIVKKKNPQNDMPQTI